MSGSERGLFDPDFCEHRCPVCTRARKGNHTHTHATTPAGHCQIGLSVADLDAFHKEMVGKGIKCVQPPKEEHFGRLAIYADPDEMPISVAEE